MKHWKKKMKIKHRQKIKKMAKVQGPYIQTKKQQMGKVFLTVENKKENPLVPGRMEK